MPPTSLYVNKTLGKSNLLDNFFFRFLLTNLLCPNIRITCTTFACHHICFATTFACRGTVTDGSWRPLLSNTNLVSVWRMLLFFLFFLCLLYPFVPPTYCSTLGASGERIGQESDWAKKAIGPPRNQCSSLNFVHGANWPYVPPMEIYYVNNLHHFLGPFTFPNRLGPTWDVPTGNNFSQQFQKCSHQQPVRSAALRRSNSDSSNTRHPERRGDGDQTIKHFIEETTRKHKHSWCRRVGRSHSILSRRNPMDGADLGCV